MACCGRSSNKPQFPKQNFNVPAPKSSVFNVGKKNCNQCGGNLQAFPKKVQVGNQNLTKYKCTVCSNIYYML